MIRILGRLGDSIPGLTNTDIDSGKWFFVDYADATIGTHSVFTVLGFGGYPNGKEISPVTLLAVVDQFGNRLTAIPKGWQTICQFDDPPKELKMLPHCKSWEASPNPWTLSL